MKTQRRKRAVKRKSVGTKSWEVVKVVLDDDVAAYFRRSGRGWQSRITAALRKAAKRKRA
ncbi:MAG: BrnA antitoxin family protein [Betaproteobacteria bacterium]|nr:BrnA antitoxin family protein [Betaproteobacteria bacterium]